MNGASNGVEEARRDSPLEGFLFPKDRRSIVIGGRRQFTLWVGRRCRNCRRVNPKRRAVNQSPEGHSLAIHRIRVCCGDAFLAMSCARLPASRLPYSTRRQTADQVRADRVTFFVRPHFEPRNDLGVAALVPIGFDPFAHRYRFGSRHCPHPRGDD